MKKAPPDEQTYITLFTKGAILIFLMLLSGYGFIACRTKEAPPQPPVAMDITPTPLPPLDPCLVGSWEATTVTSIGESAYTGGTGFTLTFKEDGTQIADYNSMKPLRAESIVLDYKGSASGKMTAQNGAAKNISVERSDVTAEPEDHSTEPHHVQMGPGALGANKRRNSYKCSDATLEFMREDDEGRPFWQIKMVRR